MYQCEAFSVHTSVCGCELTWICMQAFVYITADFKTAQNAVNEVMIWSRIVQEKRRARINEAVRLEYPYALTDPSKEVKKPSPFSSNTADPQCMVDNVCYVNQQKFLMLNSSAAFATLGRPHHP